MTKIHVPNVIARYEAGESATQLADSFGVTRQAIYMAIAGSKRYQRLQHEKKTNREDRKRLVAKFISDGMGKSDIADRLKVSLRTVLYIARELRERNE